MSPRKQPNPYLKYSNMALQMAAVIWLSVWGGNKLDQKFNNQIPIFTIVLSLLGISLAMYLVLKDLIKPKDGQQ